MIKKLFLFNLILTISLFFNAAFAHVKHYQELSRLEFDLYRNNKLIGQHIYTFERNGKNLKVISEINFEIRKLGVTLYKYYAEGEENYENGSFKSFSSTTIQNKKNKFCKFYKKDDEFFIEGFSYTGKAPNDTIIGTWWNHSIVKSNSQISAVSGRIIEQNVRFLGKEKITLYDKEYNALKFNFSSSDLTLPKNKQLNTNIWYDESTFIWLKASFDKKGYWEYRLKDKN